MTSWTLGLTLLLVNAASAGASIGARPDGPPQASVAPSAQIASATAPIDERVDDLLRACGVEVKAQYAEHADRLRKDGRGDAAALEGVLETLGEIAGRGRAEAAEEWDRHGYPVSEDSVYGRLLRCALSRRLAQFDRLPPPEPAAKTAIESILTLRAEGRPLPPSPALPQRGSSQRTLRVDLVLACAAPISDFVIWFLTREPDETDVPGVSRGAQVIADLVDDPPRYSEKPKAETLEEISSWSRFQPGPVSNYILCLARRRLAQLDKN